jgi:hypothetical protein
MISARSLRHVFFPPGDTTPYTPTAARASTATMTPMNSVLNARGNGTMAASASR